MSELDRLPPHSLEAEEAILGSLLIDPDAIYEVASFLRTDAFYRSKNRHVYEAILALSEGGSQLDLLTLADELRRREQLESVGGEGFLISLINAVPTSVNARSYGRLVEAAALRRRMISAAGTIAELAYNEAENIDIVVDKAERALFSISEDRTTRDLVPIKQIAGDYFDRIQELQKLDGNDVIGVPTGYTDLDRLLGGLNKSDLLILAARPGMGKCVTADTRLINPHTGELTTIETLVQQKKAELFTLDDEYKLTPSQAADFVDNGMKPVYRVTTALGREIKATLSHPFLTVDGWKPLHELATGSRVAVPRVLPVFGKYDAPDYEAKTLAYLIADGSVVGTSPQFSNNDPRLRDDFTKAALQFPGNKARVYDTNGSRTPTVHITQDKAYVGADRHIFPTQLKATMRASSRSITALATDLQLAYGTVEAWRSGKNFPSPANFQKLCRALDVSERQLLSDSHAQTSQISNTLTVWLQEQEVWGKSAGEKSVPDMVYRYTGDKLALFLNRLFACDGSAYLQNGSQPVISYATISYKLAKAVAHLLLRFGIIVNLRHRRVKYKGDDRPVYQLRITDSPSLLLFVDKIGIFGKEEAITAVRQRCLNTTTNTNRDTIPVEIWEQIKQIKGGQSWADVHRKMGLSPSHNLHVGKRSIGRIRLAAIADALASESLQNLAQSDIYWDEIVAIESLGERQVYDLTVPDTHNFVADDMIIHNTSLQIGIALTAALKHNKRIAMFNLEMSGEQLVQRMIAAETKIDSQRLRRGQLHEHELPIFAEAIGRLSETRIFIDDTPSITPLQLHTKCRRLYAEHGLDLIIIDYLQLMQGSGSHGGNRVQEISEISRSLKGLARELDVPVLAAAQLSRAVEQRQDKHPLLSDLRDSGSIEQDADIVMFIYRDEYYNAETTERPGIAEIQIAKHRNGPTGTVDLYWHAQLASFRNLSHQELAL